jgi:hypothetical protein
MEMVWSVLLKGFNRICNLKRKGAVLLFFLLAALLIPDAGRAQEENGLISLSATAGFEGYCRDGSWIPVRVRIENQGPGIQGRIEVPVPGAFNREVIYAREVLLPTVSQKEITLYVYPQGFLSDLAVRLVADGKEILRSTVSLTCLSSTDILYGILAESSSPFNVLSEIDPPNGSARVARLGVSEIPDEAQGLEALEALVISGIDTGQLSPAQREALVGWVAGGGRLIVSGGPDWRRTTAGLLDLLPLRPQGTQTLPAASSPDGSDDPITLPGELLAATGKLEEESEILLSGSGLPLASRRELGYGAIIFLAFDPSLEPLRSWDGLEELYRRIFDPPSVKPAWASGFQDWSLAANAVSTLPNIGLPSAGWVAGFLGLYVFAIGPANFFLLRRLKKRELAWLSIPLLVILFSSLAFLVGRSLSGGQPVLNRLAVVQIWPETGHARVDGLLGIYSPGRDTYQLEIPPQFLAHAIPGDVSTGTSPSPTFIKTDLGATRLPDLRVDVGEVRSFALEGQFPAYPIAQELSLQVDDRGAVLKGSLTNRGDQALQGAVLLAPGKSQQYGDIQPGETREIGLSLDANSHAAYRGGAAPGYGPMPSGLPGGSWDAILGTSDYYRDRQIYQRFAMLNALTAYGSFENPEHGMILAAWSDGSPLAADLGGRETLSSSATLYLIKLQPRISLAPGKINLPPGLFTWSVLIPDSTGGASPYDAVVNPGGFSLSFKPLIPLQNQPVESLTLRMKGYGATGQAGVSAELWNFTSGEWDELPALQWGETPISSPQIYVGPAGEIRLRLDNKNSISPVQVESADFILGVEG